MAQVIVDMSGPLAVVDLSDSGVAKVYLGENTAEAASQAAAAALARQEAEGLALSIEVATAGGYFETVAEGAADSSVAEGDGYFVVTDDGRVIIAKKVGGVGVIKAEFITMYLLSLGAGGGINADKLDGNDASFFTDIISRLGFTPVNKAGDALSGALTLSGDPTDAGHAARKAYVDGLVTAEALLAKLVTVDGTGSGLDADTVRGEVPFKITDSAWGSDGGYEVRSDGVIRCRGKITVAANSTGTWALPVEHQSQVWPAVVSHPANSTNVGVNNVQGIRELQSINYVSGKPVSLTLWNADDWPVIFYILTEGK